jgi:transposase InsO family protein
LGPLPTSNGYRFVLVYLDVFTGYIVLTPLADKTANSVKQTLLNNFINYGCPAICQSDNALEFTAKKIELMLKEVSIQHNLSSQYNPRANGRVERQVGNFKSVLVKLLHSDGNPVDNWSTYIPRIQYFLNSRISSVIGVSPFFLMYGRDPHAIIGGDFSKSKSEFDLQTLFQQQNGLQSIYEEVEQLHTKHYTKLIERMNSDRRLADRKLSIGSSVMLKNYDDSFGAVKYLGCILLIIIMIKTVINCVTQTTKVLLDLVFCKLTFELTTPGKAPSHIELLESI